MYTELDVRSEEVDTFVRIQVTLDERQRHGTLLDAQTTERVRELGTRVHHRERPRARTVFRVDDLVTTKLDAVRQLVIIVLSEAGGQGVRRLREEGDDLVDTSKSRRCDWTIGRYGPSHRCGRQLQARRSWAQGTDHQGFRRRRWRRGRRPAW